MTLTGAYSPGFASNQVYHVGVTYSTDAIAGVTTAKMFAASGIGAIITSGPNAATPIATGNFTLSPAVVTNTTGFLSNGTWAFGDWFTNGTVRTNDYGSLRLYSQDPGVFPAFPVDVSSANDGIPDWWKLQFGFGIADPNVAGADTDGTGQTNLFKFAAGLNPIDPNSRFTVLALASGQPARQSIVFSPVVAGRTYRLTYKADLNDATWSPVAGVTFADIGTQRTMTDPVPLGAKRFYRIEFTKP